MRIAKAIVPAAGQGTRLYPVTKSQPKEMLPLGTKPTIQRAVEEIIAAGITNILVVTGQGKHALEDHFDPTDGIAPTDVDSAEYSPVVGEPTTSLYFIRQGEPRGLGDAVLQGRQFVGDEDFVVALGDSVIVGGREGALVSRLIDAHRQFSADGVICVQPVNDEGTCRYGIVEPSAELAPNVIELSDIVEKPGPEAAPSHLAVTARYTFSPAIFEYLAALDPGRGGEIQLTDAIRDMIADGRRVLAVPLSSDEHRLDVGNFESYGRAFFRTMMTHPRYGEALRAYAASLLSYLENESGEDPDSVSGEEPQARAGGEETAQ